MRDAEQGLGELMADAMTDISPDVIFALFESGSLVWIAGCDGPTAWFDAEDPSIAFERSSEPAPGGIPCLEIVAGVGLVRGRWWWVAMGPRFGSAVPEETREDAKRAVTRCYARFAAATGKRS